ncbi:dUTP diphosphatase [Megamonas hypermegale]|uniref:dUTP diphosphatase n=1 Tax=Megamonas hypermegale TaxID=158847 RepID=UPI0025A37C95|nr:dUTP diphosphatase [Megamonas hypermegale]MDM8142855.1 dUTP diphosphatase [Megamonas hypermegale]
MRKRGFEIISDYKDKDIHLPVRKTAKSAGYDLEAAQDKLIKAGQCGVIATGLKAYMQDDEYLGIHIRSSLAFKKHLNLINSQGVIDADYYNNPDNEGHIMIGLINFGTEDVFIQKGMRIAQAIFYKFLTVDDDIANDSIRQGGFGSTGE